MIGVAGRTGIAEKAPLWCDDHVASFDGVIRRMQARGLDPVTEEIPVSELPPHVVEMRSRFILDNRYGNQNLTGGTVDAEKLVRGDDRRVILFSAFLDEERRRRKIDIFPERNSAILYVPKAHFDVDMTSEYFESLAKCFHDFFETEFDRISKVKVPKQPAHGVADLSFDDFESLPLREKAKLYSEFRKEAGQEIDELLRNGAIWILYAGSPKEPYKIAHTRGEILTEEEVANVARSLGVVPFIFRKDVRVESFGCIEHRRGATGENPISTYPHAEVSFGDRGTKSKIHFDTGLDITLLCDEYLSRQGAERFNVRTFGELELAGGYHVADRIDIDALLYNERTDAVPPAAYGQRMSALAVDRWLECNLQVACAAACPRHSQNVTACRFRDSGLLGRSSYLGFEETFDIQIDARTHRVKFLRRER